MSYENPSQPEGINISPQRPLREFLSLLLVVVLALGLLVATLSLAAQWLAAQVPFELEVRLAKDLVSELAPDQAAAATDPGRLKREAYLRTLAERLTVHMDLPPGMHIDVRYLTDPEVNAYAGLGGQVVLFQGLVDRLPNENALALVLAHEIAHIKLRHPIVATGRGLTVALALTAVLGVADNAAVGRIVEWVGVSETRGFSRAQERAADTEAARAVLAEYGHLRGARALFDALRPERSGAQALMPEFSSTHPSLESRIEALESLARTIPAEREQAITPLPWEPRD